MEKLCICYDWRQLKSPKENVKTIKPGHDWFVIDETEPTKDMYCFIYSRNGGGASGFTNVCLMENLNDMWRMIKFNVSHSLGFSIGYGENYFFWNDEKQETTNIMDYVTVKIFTNDELLLVMNGGSECSLNEKTRALEYFNKSGKKKVEYFNKDLLQKLTPWEIKDDDYGCTDHILDDIIQNNVHCYAPVYTERDNMVQLDTFCEYNKYGVYPPQHAVFPVKVECYFDSFQVSLSPVKAYASHEKQLRENFSYG